MVIKRIFFAIKYMKLDFVISLEKCVALFSYIELAAQLKISCTFIS